MILTWDNSVELLAIALLWLLKTMWSFKEIFLKGDLNLELLSELLAITIPRLYRTMWSLTEFFLKSDLNLEPLSWIASHYTSMVCNNHVVI